jgi:hypothetical protein
MQFTAKHMKALEPAQREQYFDVVVQRLTQHFPQHAAALGPKGLREVAALGLDKAGSHGIEGQDDVYLFTCVMVAFGEQFDRNPALPWAAQILASRILGGPHERVQRLYDTALACAGQTGRPHVPLPEAKAA